MNFLVIIIVFGLTVIGGFAGTVYDSFWPAGSDRWGSSWRNYRDGSSGEREVKA